MENIKTPGIAWTSRTNQTRCGRVTINGVEHEVMMERERYNRGSGRSGYCWSYAFITRSADGVTVVSSGWVYSHPVASVNAAARELRAGGLNEATHNGKQQ